MFSSAPGESPRPEGKPQGLSRFVRRASKVLRKGTSARASISSLGDFPPPQSHPEVLSDPVESSSIAAAPAAAPPPSATVLPTTPAITAPSTTAPVPAALPRSIKDAKAGKEATDPKRATTALASSAVLEEKARALFLKYGLTLEPGEWTHPARGDAERVEKKIRMRVHRTCHRCSATFGVEKVCNECHHTRCKKCPRVPAKKPKDAQAKGAVLSIPVVAVDEELKKGVYTPMPLTMSHRQTGKELTRRVPVQRVRRTCHKCDTLFVGKATQCEGCHHLRCPRCPREPPKTSKYPNGYPGDLEETFPLARREFRPIRMHVRWTCHACNITFKDREKICASCSHHRCNDCARQPPKRVKAPLDETAIQSIAEKMKNIIISSQTPAPAA